MTRTILTALALGCAVVFPAFAGHTAADGASTPGLVSAALLPAATAADGSRVAAVHLVLEPGWKTYWRSPGDSGVPPRLDWTGSANLRAAEPVWPRPEVIESGGERTLGYHDELVLPIRITADRAGAPVDLKLALDFGLCRDICVPARVELAAPQGDAGAIDARVAAALDRVPVRAAAPMRCALDDIADGVRVTAEVAAPAHPGEAAALELALDGVWVSQADLTRDGDRLTAAADVVAPSGKPFPLDPAGLRLTLIHDGGAVEYAGCDGAPAGG